MATLDDFQVDNNDEDKTLGDEEYMKNTVDSNDFSDPNSADNDSSEAETIDREVSLEELAEQEMADEGEDI